MKKLISLVACFLLTTLSAYASPEGWMIDLEAAKKKAAEENKGLLLNFTGSDWCGACIRLHNDVFKTEAFQVYVEDRFVLVEIDLPQDKSKLSEATIAQNEQLQMDFSVRTFPTILLMDAQGRPYARTGYLKGGPVPYVAHLEERIKVKTDFKAQITAADQLEGVEKSKAYIAAMSLIPEEYARFYEAELNTIYLNDPEDTTKYRAKITWDQKTAELVARVSVCGDYDLANTIIETFEKETEMNHEMKTEIMLYRLRLAAEGYSARKGDKVAESKVLAAIETELSAASLDIDTKQEILSYKDLVYGVSDQHDKQIEVIDQIIALDSESSFGKRAIRNKNAINKNHTQ